MTASFSKPPLTWSNVALIAFRASCVTLSSNAFDLGIQGGPIATRSILIDVTVKRFDT